MTTFEDASTLRKPTEGVVKTMNGPLVVILFFAAHVPLALLMRQYPEIATWHALAILAIGLWWAVSRSRSDWSIYVCAYITGAEVLWRMEGANVFWEFGKYAVAAILIVRILRARRLSAPIPIVLYFLLLLPSAGMLLAANDLLLVRRDISFNLSGPFTLMISAWFFSRQTLNRQMVLRLFAAFIAPLIGIASITLYATLTAPDILFVNESNLTTSGGFGPNQVSAMLGAGALLCFVCLLEGSVSRKVRLVLLGLLVLFAVESAMTFSRGGLFIAFTSAMLTALLLMKDRRARIRLVVLGALLFLFGSYVLLPKLDEFTRGYLITRFRNTGPTRRDEIVADDLKTWEDNPVFGVGPGQAKFRHQSFGRPVAAHTEYSRLVAEHGVFGLAALVLLVVAAAHTITGAGSALDRVVKVMLVSWSLLFMLGDAMRLAAPAFLMGLAFATLFPEAIKLKDRYRRRSGRYFLPGSESEAHHTVHTQHSI
jgi:hypothetical protein